MSASSTVISSCSAMATQPSKKSAVPERLSGLHQHASWLGEEITVHPDPHYDWG